MKRECRNALIVEDSAQDVLSRVELRVTTPPFRIYGAHYVLPSLEKRAGRKHNVWTQVVLLRSDYLYARDRSAVPELTP